MYVIDDLLLLSGSDFIAQVRDLTSTLKKSERAELASAAQLRALKEFSPEKMVNSHLALFEEILSR
jgi:hypothetical protein